ncbi:FecR domain-containing protein [Longitalea luteola]|uniref:FecR domain-containing protein n=1 Tax=Longitalea luteola TaxID=2812563 RepID=UPI001A95A5C1|nr:FecR domain-containing protein [Longitalea luteola]
MDRNNFLELLDKYLRGTASPVEQQLVEDYYKRLSEKDEIPLPADKESALEARMLQNIRQGMQRVPVSPARSHGMFRWMYAAAASVLIVLAASLYFAKKDVQRPEPVVKQNKAPDIAPGRNVASLTLADGSRIILDQADNGILANEGAATVSKAKDGQLVYHAGSAAGSAAATAPGYNTIATPYGGQYQVILPDGTKVWLNAGSALTFPTVFTGSTRSVQLKGEAYFEVAHNASLPFTVEGGGSTVQVLGTKFNIMAYEDEKKVNTTLLEGSVKIIKGNKSRLLRPGEQSTIKGEEIAISDADVDAALAWKDGYFVFKNEDLASIMRKIARWYNVTIQYEGHFGNKTFGGRISRSRNVSEVLKMLELTGSIRFKMLDIETENAKKIVVY